jgi:isoleucyl-tRNA synthetase
MDQNQLREKALDEVKKVMWLPEWGQARIEGMMANRPDWCISRQRTWGVPIALFVHKETGGLHPRSAELIEQVSLRIEKAGIDAWFNLEVSELLGNEACLYDKITDTLDVWFDSGVTHAGVLERYEQLHFPADLYLEGSDQHRGWFQSSLLASVAMNGVAPYKSVLTHGFTVDAKGEKMSKSKGNVIPPQAVMKTLGADVLRLWIASTDYRGEMRVSDEILERTSDGYRRLRNTARFLLSNLNDFNPMTDRVEIAKLLPLERWVLDRAYTLQEDVKLAYEAYQFQTVFQKVHHFCVIDLGGFYLDIIKDRQYTTKADSLARRSTQTAMFHVLEALTRWIAPILSYTADEIWQHLPTIDNRPESVFLTTWYEELVQLNQQTPFNYDFWQLVMEIRAQVSAALEHARVNGDIGASLTASIELTCNRLIYDKLVLLNDELRFIFITSEATLKLDEQDDLNEKSPLITVKKSDKTKCVRCWHQRDDVGVNSEYAELCGRCIENVYGEGENRLYA